MLAWASKSCVSLCAERDLEGVASQPEAAVTLDIDRLRRVDALNGYGIHQEGTRVSQPLQLVSGWQDGETIRWCHDAR